MGSSVHAVTRHRALAVLLALGCLLAGCTGTQEPADDTAAEEPAETTVAQSEEGEGAAPDGGGEVEQVARTWLEDTYGIDGEVLAALELAEVRTSPGVQHVRFTQTVDGVDVVDAEITVHVLDSGEVQSATDDLVDAQPGDGEASVDEATALDIATKAVTGEVTGEPDVGQVWLPNGQQLQLAWRVEVSTASPMSSWVVFVDAASGDVLSAERATFGERRPRVRLAPGAAVVAAAQEVAQRAGSGARSRTAGDVCEVTAPGACVFLPHPIFAAGGQLEDASQANEFATPVELQGLESDDALVGEYVDTEPDDLPVEPAREDDGTWAGGRATPGFEAAMVYYWIDRVQRHIQDLGFSDVLDHPFPVYPVDPAEVDNAFYSPSEVAIHMGVGSDGINEGEDADGIVHEYGHAVLDAQAPGLGGGEGAAYHEAFGDLLAFLTSLEHRNGDPACLFAWAEEGECLRRVDTDGVYPDDIVNSPHADGMIYTGAVHDITAALLDAQGVDIGACPGTTDCAEVVDRVLTTLLVSHTYLPNTPTLPDVAEAYLLANDAAYGGEDADVITDGFAAHGLTGGGDSMVDSGGQDMGGGGDVVLEIDITHSYRGDLEVIAGVIGPDGEDLCEPIEVATPDADDAEDDLLGQLDVSDSECAALVPPSPEQVWYLQAIDTLAEDEGQINAFAVLVDGLPHLASGLPTPIGDADPAGTFAFVAGADADVHPEEMADMGGTASGDSPVMTIDITHTYLGDLDISAGVADADGTITCSVNISEPDASNDDDAGIAGDVDMSECADAYPPSPDQQWFLSVTDTAAADTGTVDQMTLTGPDGQTFDFSGVPVEIPDADPDGVALLLAGSGGSTGQAGGSGSAGDITAAVTVTHPYRGDLAVTAGVLDADGNAACEVVLSAPDQADDADGLAVEVSLADCARYYPPTPAQPWYIFVADTLAADTGTLDTATLTGPDGTTHAATEVPTDIPDADPAGVTVLFDGSGSGGGAAGAGGASPGEVVADVEISHTYAGDLAVNVGVTDAEGTVLCETPVLEPDPENSESGLVGEVSFGECGALYPPSPDTVFYLEVIDTAGADTGQVEVFTVRGPDGQSHPASGLPAPIPDDDPSGVVVGASG